MTNGRRPGRSLADLRDNLLFRRLLAPLVEERVRRAYYTLAAARKSVGGRERRVGLGDGYRENGPRAADSGREGVISDQQGEIEELSSIKERDFGSSEMADTMNLEDPSMFAMLMPEELAKQ